MQARNRKKWDTCNKNKNINEKVSVEKTTFLRNTILRHCGNYLKTTPDTELRRVVFKLWVIKLGKRIGSYPLFMLVYGPQ